MPPKRSDTTERLAVLESAVSSITKDVGEISGLLKEEARLSADRSHDLAQSISALANQQGRHDFPTMARWAGVVVAVLSPVIAFMIVLGAREVDRIDMQATREIARIEEKIDANSNTGNVIQMREQIKLNAVVANLYRDETYRLGAILGAHVGTEIPPPTFFPDAQEVPRP
jgi:hypothetical protein